MSLFTRLLLLTVSLSLLGCEAPVKDIAVTDQGAANRLRAHVTFLADDLMAGRKPGTPGYDIGANYVAAAFSALGLKPAGDDSTFFQQVPLVRASLIGDVPKLVVGDQAFTANDLEVTIGPSLAGGIENISAQAVFVGYGLDAPDYGVNDYEGLDLQNKIAIFLNGFPEDLPGEVGAFLMLQKTQMARRRGAIATIEIETRASLRRRPWKLIRDTFSKPVISWRKADGAAELGPTAQRATLRLTGAPSAALFKNASSPLEDVLEAADAPGAKPKGFDLNQRVTLLRHSSLAPLSSANVLGAIPGADPRVSNEAVILTAHLDHIGTIAHAGDDHIYNGAMDNSIGVATIIEIARQIKQSQLPPRRTIVFAALTAEEDGMVGSHYLARNPASIKATSFVAAVNIDMPILLYELGDIVALGASHSSLSSAVDDGAAQLGLKHSPDPAPEEGRFTRSDHYRFVEQGVPAISLQTGGLNGGTEKSAAFRGTHYHQPSDDLNLPFNWSSAETFSKVGARITKKIADQKSAPQWNADSIFAKTFARDDVVMAQH